MIFFEKELKVRLTFAEECLGSSPASQDVYRDYIASKAPDAATIEDEIEAVGVDETADNKMTVFPPSGRQSRRVGLSNQGYVQRFLRRFGACKMFGFRKAQGLQKSNRQAYIR